jgi:hypothetical protein
MAKISSIAIVHGLYLPVKGKLRSLIYEFFDLFLSYEGS